MPEKIIGETKVHAAMPHVLYPSLLKNAISVTVPITFKIRHFILGA
jgi:hypothetical protein